MSKFSYNAIMLNGSKAKGVIEAKDLADAKNQLKAKKLRVVELKEKKETTLFKKKKKIKKIKS